MAITDVISNAQQGQQYVQDLQSYFSNYLTVQTFVGNYGLQRFNTLNTAFGAILIDVQQATPNTIDIVQTQLPALQQAINDLLTYDQNYLTVQTFGGNYMTERLNWINQAITVISADPSLV